LAEILFLFLGQRPRIDKNGLTIVTPSLLLINPNAVCVKKITCVLTAKKIEGINTR